MKTGTWAYMGSVSDTGSDHKNQDRYWFWTSVDINKNGFQAGETVPMIVSTAAPVANADATNTIGTSGELRNGTAG